jgi:AcrR family transcriptional regulator
MQLVTAETNPPAPNKLMRSQDARRERILDATYSLAREGGYDAVQLRLVSRRSRVALATIYRYFSSRDQLIAAAIIRRPLPELHPPDSGVLSPAEARDWLKRAYRWLMEPFEREPNLLEAWARASASRTPEVSALAAARSEGFFAQFAKVFPEDDPEFAADVVMILRNVWHWSVNQWVYGGLAIGDIYDQLERTIDRLIPVTAADLKENEAIARPRKSRAPVRNKRPAHTR